MVSGVLKSHRVDDFTGCYVETPIGEVLLWMLFEQKETHRFGENSVPLLRALLPSFKAGLDALVRFDAQRMALDLIEEAMVVFGPGRKELHRNSALSALYQRDAEAEQIQAEVTSLAISLDLLGFPRSGRVLGVPFIQSDRNLTTKTARYRLTRTLLPAGAFGGDVSTMVRVTRQGGVELRGPEVLRDRYGVTAREAEVALLLARGFPNDQIAEQLYLSPHTVRRHTANIFDKLDVKSRKALALKFLED
jgi:DNA-binding CsgD family transcriptional regulator